MLNLSKFMVAVCMVVCSGSAAASTEVFDDIADEANRLYQQEGHALHVIATHLIAAADVPIASRQGIRPLDGHLFRQTLQDCLFMRKGLGTTHFGEGEQAAVAAEFELFLERTRIRGVREFFRINAPSTTIWPFTAPLMAPCVLGVVVGDQVLVLRGTGGR